MSFIENIPVVGPRVAAVRRRESLRLFVTGFVMGSADIVPGVSGGTIALIFGIYERLIESIKVASGDFLKTLVKGDVKKAFKVLPLNFLMPLGFGILTAVVSLAQMLSWLLADHPVLVWSFFFGLILASVWIVSRRIETWDYYDLASLILAAVAAFWIVGLVPVETPETLLAFFLSGMVAIVAMILPGISGSFLLVILGKYEQVLGAISEHDFLTLAVFGIGAVIGLGLFSRVLSWLFDKYHDVIVAILTGFMLGSLRKVWPWKEVLETRVDRHGDIVPLIEKNVLPGGFNLELVLAVGLCGAAIWLIMYLNKIKFVKEEN